MKTNYIIVWPICRKVYWSSLVHESIELMHVLYFFCDLPLHNAVLSCLSLLCDSWQSLTVMTEVLRSHFRLSQPAGKQCFGVFRGFVTSFEKVFVQCSPLHVLLCVPGFEPAVFYLCNSSEFHFPHTTCWRIETYNLNGPCPASSQHSHSHNNKRLGNYHATCLWNASLINQTWCVLPTSFKIYLLLSIFF